MTVVALARRIGAPWLFGAVLLLQLGHLIEHISMAVQGKGLLGPAFNTELSHFLFNAAIFALATTMLYAYPTNPWVYPLVLLSGLHELEHCFIYWHYLQTGLPGQNGLLGIGGAVGVLPISRFYLHNIYNASEVVLMVLGFLYQTDMSDVSMTPFNRRSAVESNL